MKHSTLSIILIYNIVTVIVIAAFYPIIPILMGYAPNFIDSTIALGISYNVQYVFVVFFTIVIGTIFFLFAFRGIKEWGVLSKDDVNYETKIRKVREKCINLPYLIYIGQVTIFNIPLLVVFLGLAFFMRFPTILSLKIFTIAFSLFSLAGVFSHTFAKRIFTRILLKTYHGQALEGIRVKLVPKIFLQIIPVLMVAILFTIILGYSRMIEEKGDMAYFSCKTQLTETLNSIGQIKDEKQAFEVLKKIKIENTDVSYFVIPPKGKIISSAAPITNSTFLYYIDHPYKGDRVYGNSNESQGVMKKVMGNGGEWVVGIKFDFGSTRSINFFLFAFFALLALNIFIIYFFSKTLAGEISLVADGLTEIARGKNVDLDHKLAVTSNDEVGDLVIAFNKIQELQKENKRVIDEKNEELTAMNEELIAANEQLQDYSVTVEELAITKERNRFARDMHDTLGHTLTMLVKMLEVSSVTCTEDVKKTQEDLKKAVEIARDGVKEVRNSVSGLAPVKLEQQGIEIALESLISVFRQTSGVDIHFSVEGVDKDLGPVYADVIYRTCQEAMTNAVRHGKAKRIVIILRQAADRIKLNILDDGVGCEEIKKGFGLSGMEQRVKELDGSLQFGASEEGGFHITVEIPFKGGM